MPVNFGFSSDNAKGLMLKLGIPKPVIEAAESLGWKLALTDKEISLSKGSVTHAVPVSLAALQAANSGKLSPKDQAALEGRSLSFAGQSLYGHRHRLRRRDTAHDH